MSGPQTPTTISGESANSTMADAVPAAPVDVTPTPTAKKTDASSPAAAPSRETHTTTKLPSLLPTTTTTTNATAAAAPKSNAMPELTLQVTTAAPAPVTTTSLATMHAYITGQFTDARDWVVALRDPSQTAAASSKKNAGGHAATHNSADSRTPGTAAATVTRAPPSLEQRLDVVGLQRLMHAFSEAVSLPEYLDTMREALTSHEAAASPLAPTHLGTPGVPLSSPWVDAFDEASKEDSGVSRPPSAQSPPSRALTLANTTRPPTRRTRSAEDLTAWLLSAADALQATLPAQDSYTRRLSLESFTEVVQVVVPHTTDAEVRELMTKVDYEAHGTITWTDLATFLVSESRHSIHMALAKTELETAIEPRNMPRTDLHESITDVALDPRKRVLLTGGSEGTVRAWTLTDLSPRGLLFSNKHWITGVHCGHRSRHLFITTLDRELFVLDGNSYEVLRVYHGRPIAETNVGLTYARETLRTVRVGGVKAPAPQSLTTTTTAAASSATALPSLPSSSSSSNAQGSSTGRMRSASPSLASAGSRSRRARRPQTPQERQQTRLQHVLHGGGTSSGTSTQASGGLLGAMAARPLTAAMAQQTLASTDTSPLTGGGRGPYREKRLTEGVLLGLVDSVTCSLFMHTVFDEEVLLLATSEGDVHIFVLDLQKPANVLKPRRCLRLHPGKAIHKMSLLPSLDALLTCADDGTVRMTSLINTQTMRIYSAAGLPEHHAAVHDMAVCDESKILVTVGPERRGLVWDLAQETPIAVLEAHNSPCRSCAILARQQQILTSAADGALFVFDMHNFHRVQSVQLGSGHVVVRRLMADETRQRCVALGRHPFALRVKRQATSACPAQYTGPVASMFTSLYTPVFDVVVTVDQDRMVMTWDRATGKNVFAFLLKDFSDSEAMNQLRLTVASLDELGRRLLTGFHNGVVVVWNAVNGQPVSLITAATVEEERAAVTTSAGRARPPTSSSSARALGETNGTWAGTTTNTMGGTTATTAGTISVGGGDPSAPKPPPPPQQQPQPRGRDVTAVGSLVRLGTTYLLFAAHRTLYTVPESVTFTVATATRWLVPESYGDITTIAQVTSQSVVCGTSQGALFFYNVLQEKQEGATQYAQEVVYSVVAGTASAAAGAGAASSHTAGPASPTAAAGAAAATQQPHHNNTTNNNSSTTNGRRRSSLLMRGGSLVNTATVLAGGATSLTTVSVSQNGTMCVSNMRSIHSRVTRLVPLRQVSPYMLLSLHADGTIALWQTVRRTYLGNLNLTSAGIDEGRESGGAVVADVNARSTHLVFADEGGNVHVCAMCFRRLEPGSALETAVMTADNPALHLSAMGASGRDPLGTMDESQTHGETLTTGLLSQPSDEQSVSLLDAGTSTTTAASEEENGASRGGGGSRGAHAEERVLYVPDSFERVWAFGTGLDHIVSLLVLDPKTSPTAASAHQADDAHDGEGGYTNAERDEEKDDEVQAWEHTNTRAARRCAVDEPIVVCTNHEHYTRVFTLRGDVIGEFGMGEWDLADPSTYSYLGERTAGLPSTMIPYSKLNGEDTDAAMKAAVYYDYLSEAYAAQREARRQAVNTANAANTRRSRGRSQTQRRSSLGSVTGMLAGSIVLGGAPAHATATTTSPPGSPLHTPPTTTTTNSAVAAAAAASSEPQTTGPAVTTLASSLKEALAVPGFDAAAADLAGATGGEDASHAAGAQQQQLLSRPYSSHDSQAHALDTTIAKSTRLRYGQRTGYRGLVKRGHAAFVRRQAAAASVQHTFVASQGGGREANARPGLFHTSDDDDNDSDAATSTTDKLELQTEFLALLTRSSMQDGSAPDPAGPGPLAGGDTPLATPSMATAAATASHEPSHVSAASGSGSAVLASASTPWGKASLATTAPGEGPASPPSSSSILERAPPGPGAGIKQGWASPVSFKAEDTGSTASATPPPPQPQQRARAEVSLTTPTSQHLMNATPATSETDTPPRLAPSAQRAGVVGGASAATTTTTTAASPVATMATAHAGTSRRHKPGGASVAVRPDSATLAADARQFTHTMLAERRDRILNSTANAATLRALREADGSSDAPASGKSGADNRAPAATTAYSVPGRPGSGAAAGLSEDLGPTLTPMHAQVNSVLRRRRQHDTGLAATLYGASASGGGGGPGKSPGTATAVAGTQSAPSFISQVASKMYVAPMPALPSAPTAHTTGARDATFKHR